MTVFDEKDGGGLLRQANFHHKQEYKKEEQQEQEEEEREATAGRSFWGNSSFSSFASTEKDHNGTINLQGQVTSAILAVDWQRSRWVAGAALARSNGLGSYQESGSAQQGRLRATLTALFPYARYLLNPQLSFWGTVGYGIGDLSLLSQGQDAITTTSSLSLAAGGLTASLLAPPQGEGGLSLSATTDALLLQTSSFATEGMGATSADVSRLRLALDSSYTFLSQAGSSLSPSLQVAIRQDGGSLDTGFGAHLAAALHWQDPNHGIAAALRGHTLLMHSSETLKKDQGLSLSFYWNPTPSTPLGPSLSISQSMGQPGSGNTSQLLLAPTLQYLPSSPAASPSSLHASFAYGLPAFKQSLALTPELGFSLLPHTSTGHWSLSLSPLLHSQSWHLLLEGQHQLNHSLSSNNSLDILFSFPF